MSDYEPIGKCFVIMNNETGEVKNNGLIEVIDDNKYKEILNKKYHTVEKDIILETSKYRTKSYNANINRLPYKSNKNDIQSAFIAGRNMGIMQGYKMAKITHN
jgi:hypothetical protein